MNESQTDDLKKKVEVGVIRKPREETLSETWSTHVRQSRMGQTMLLYCFPLVKVRLLASWLCDKRHTARRAAEHEAKDLRNEK